MKEVLNLQDPKALFSLLPYDKRIYRLGRMMDVEHIPYIFFLEHETVPFDYNDSEFNLNNAWWLSELSFLAYEEGETIGNILTSLGLRVQFFNSSRWDGEAYIAYDDDKVFLVYRGTEPTNLKDMLTDIRVNKVNIDNKDVHSGFKKHFDDLEKEFRIGSILSALLTGKRKLYITGHSLGAALAVYSAYYYSHTVKVTDMTEYILYTFGAPKVGSKEFTAIFNDVNVYRIVHKNDIVCRMPPPFMGKFCHVGDLYYIGFDKSTKLTEELPGYDLRVVEEGDFAAGIFKQSTNWAEKKFRKYGSLLLDHSPLYYSIRLKQAAQDAAVVQSKAKTKNKKAIKN